MSIELLAKLKELAEKGITDVKEAIGYIEGELSAAVGESVAPVESTTPSEAVATPETESAGTATTSSAAETPSA